MGGRCYDNGCLAPLSMFQLYHGSLFVWVEKIVATEENDWPSISNWQTLSHNFVSFTPCMSVEFVNLDRERQWFHR